jgi:hypothetical protein
MTNNELQRLFEGTSARICELKQKYKSGERMTRRDCLDIRECNKRLRLVAMELWIAQGKPDGFAELERPEPWRPFPWRKPLNLTDSNGGVH